MGYFEWGVESEGYEWREAHPVREQKISPTTERFLTPGFTLAWKRYQPLEDTPALYRTFAEVDRTEAGIQAFANAYGALGVGEHISLVDGPAAHGEHFDFWETHLLAMQHVLLVWDALKARAHER